MTFILHIDLNGYVNVYYNAICWIKLEFSFE